MIEIQGLTVDTYLGVYDWEQAHPQSITLDLSIGPVPASAYSQDELTATIDYAAVVQGLTSFIAKQRIQLLETLADHIWRWLSTTFNITWCQLTLYKCPVDLPQIKQVALHIQRSVESASCI